jgi:DNA-binding response OmpR family regulator
MVQAAHSARPLRILFVEDDPVIGEATLAHLERHRYDAVWVTDGLEAWERFGEPGPVPFDVVLCDVMLPGMDGVTLCRRVREVATTPFVLISARGDAIDVVGGLEAGADDYVVKPFDIQVLLARVRSVVRRAEAVPRSATGGTGAVEVFGDLALDRSALELRRDGRVLTLTPTEMRLFMELAESPGTVLSRRTLLSRVWDYDEWSADSHLVDVHVQRLRSKVGSAHIETVRGFGYKLRP